MEKMANFKGLFHNQHIEIPSYEGGAHFKYSDLIAKLNHIIRHISPRRLSNKSSANDSSTDEIIIDTEKHNLKKHISKSKNKQKSNHRYNKSEFILPKINNNKLNHIKNTIDVKNDSINNLITNDTESNLEKTILPKIITKSDASLNKTSKKIHQRVITEENVLLKSEDFNKKRKQIFRQRIINEGNNLIKSEDFNKKRRKVHHKRVITEGNDILKSEDLNKKRKKNLLQEEKSIVNFEDYKEIIEPLTIKHNRKRNYENDTSIVERINELKKTLLGLDNKDKKIRLKPSFKIE